MMKRFLQCARTFFLGTISVIPLLMAVALCGVGTMGPTLLLMSPELEIDTAAARLDWHGIGALPARVWQTMREPVRGRWVHLDGPAFWARRPAQDGFGLMKSRFRRKCVGLLMVQPGEYLLATGPRGVALATSHCSSSAALRRPGVVCRMRVQFLVPHFVLLPCAVLLSAYCFLSLRGGPLFWWRWIRQRFLIPKGHCRCCGYNLYGLTENRCPECGKPITHEGNVPRPTADPSKE